MADLRIVDAPEIPTEDITGQEKLPTGGSGNYSITLDSVADYTKTKKDLADNTSVDGKVNGVRQELDAHIEDLLNPHQVTKGQIGLGNVDNTADLDKPVSNSTQSAIISAVTPKANKSDVYTKQESNDLVNNSISTALTPVNDSLELSKRGIANRYDSSLIYNSGERVVLTNGDILKSTIDGNTNDPNSDMVGWVNISNVGEVETIADLLAIPSPKNGSRVFVKSRNPFNAALNSPFSGGGEFVYDPSKSSINDGGLIFNGWVRVWDGTTVHVDWFGADPSGINDSTDAVKATLQATVGTLKSAPYPQKVATIEFGAGYYRVGDIPLISGVTYKGQGKTSTFLFPKEGATWVFYSTPESFEGNPIDAAHRLTHCHILDMNIGWGYVARIPASLTGYSITAGGVTQRASSWCKFKNVGIHGIGGVGLELLGVFDADYDDLSMFSVGRSTNSPALIIDRDLTIPNENDGSNCLTFRRLHIETVYKHFHIGRNSKVINFNNPKFESCTVGSTMVDIQGITFTDMQISNSSVLDEFPFITITDGDSSYSPVGVTFVNPMFNRMPWFIRNQSRATVKILGGTGVGLKKMYQGGNLILSDFFGFYCGSQFITCSNSEIKDCTFKNNEVSNITDGSQDFIITVGANNLIENNNFLCYGTENVAFISLSANSTIRDNIFAGTVPFAIRGAEQATHYNNYISPSSPTMQLYTETVKNWQISMKNRRQRGLGEGSIDSNSAVVAVETSQTVSGILGGGSFVTCRISVGSSHYNLLLLADSGNAGNVTIVAHNCPFDVKKGSGVTSDGFLWVNNSTVSSGLTFTNHTTSSITVRCVTVNTVS